MNFETRTLTKEEYIEIIQTLRTGYLNHRPNPKVAMALVMEANIGIRISDITHFSLDKVIKEGNKYRLNLIEQKTGQRYLKAKGRILPTLLCKIQIASCLGTAWRKNCY